MLNIVLFEPEIPPNTGNIIRLCANTGCRLILIEPLGFEIDDKKLRRAGLDYGEWKDLVTYKNWQAFIEEENPNQLFGLTTKGTAFHCDISMPKTSYLVFGPETRGLPPEILEEIGVKNWVRIPMRPESRSMNLSNAVSVIVYDAWRKLDFDGAI